jgi:hypothetical protein
VTRRSRGLCWPAALIAVLLAGCGAGDPGQGVQHDAPLQYRFVDRSSGVTVRYPGGWWVDRRGLTRLTSPRQLLVVSSFAIRQRRPDPNCTPATAISELPPGGALLLLLEEPLADNPPGAKAFFSRRPVRFHLERLAARDRECFGVSRELAFRSAGRDIYVLAYLGRRVSLHTETLADQVLDSLVIPQAPSDVLARDPYMGVSCSIPNSIACDRVGLSVWLRRPAVAVSATIAGAPVKLDDRQWSGPRHDGRRTLFAGFLQPAGIVSRLHVTPDPGSPTTWEANSAVPAVLPPPAIVRLRIDYGHGRVVITQTRVELHAAWG